MPVSRRRGSDQVCRRKIGHPEPGTCDGGAELLPPHVLPIVKLDRIDLPALQGDVAVGGGRPLLTVVVQVEDDVAVAVPDDDPRAIVRSDPERVVAGGRDVQRRLVDDPEVVLVCPLSGPRQSVAQRKDVEVVDIARASQRAGRDGPGLVRSAEIPGIDGIGPLTGKRPVARDAVIAAPGIDDVVATPGGERVVPRCAGVGVAAAHSGRGAAVLGQGVLPSRLKRE